MGREDRVRKSTLIYFRDNNARERESCGDLSKIKFARRVCIYIYLSGVKNCNGFSLSVCERERLYNGREDIIG